MKIIVAAFLVIAILSIHFAKAETVEDGPESATVKAIEEESVVSVNKRSAAPCYGPCTGAPGYAGGAAFRRYIRERDGFLAWNRSMNPNRNRSMNPNRNRGNPNGNRPQQTHHRRKHGWSWLKSGAHGARSKASILAKGKKPVWYGWPRGWGY